MERELSDIQDPFVYLDDWPEKQIVCSRQAKAWYRVVSRKRFPSEYADEIRKIVAEFERVVPLPEPPSIRLNGLGRASQI